VPAVLHQQAAGKPELTNTEQLMAAYANTALSVEGVLLLLVTVDGKDLGAATADLQPLAAVPVGPKPVPFLGNKLCYATGMGSCIRCSSTL